MKINNKTTASDTKLNVNKTFHFTLKRLLIVPAIAVGFLVQPASAQNIPVPNGNFTDTSNNGHIGGGIIGNAPGQLIGSGPWSGQSHGVLLLAAPKVTIATGYGEIGTVAGVGLLGTSSSIFQTLSGVTYAANTTYQLNATVTSDSLLGVNVGDVLTALHSAGVGVGFTAGGNTTSAGTLLEDSTTTNPLLTLLGGNAVQLSLSYTTGNTPNSGNMGVVLFDNPSVKALGGVRFSNASLKAVPEPSTVVLAAIFGCGLLLLLRRKKSNGSLLA